MCGNSGTTNYFPFILFHSTFRDRYLILPKLRAFSSVVQVITVKQNEFFFQNCGGLI